MKFDSNYTYIQYYKENTHLKGKVVLDAHCFFLPVHRGVEHLCAFLESVQPQGLRCKEPVRLRRAHAERIRLQCHSTVEYGTCNGQLAGPWIARRT